MTLCSDGWDRTLLKANAMQTETLPMSTGQHEQRSDAAKREGLEPPPSSKWPRRVNWVSALTVVVCLIVLVRVLPVDRAIQSLQGSVDNLGAAGPIVFGAAYILAGLLFVPGSALTLASGALFGLLWGTIIVSAASTITAAFAFLIARYLARSAVQRAAKGNARFGAIDRAIGQGGWRIVALLRLSPAVPFSLGNYLYGLTSIRFWPYVLASWICMLPGTFMYIYIGHIGAEGLQAASGDAGAVNLGKTVLLIAGLIATIVVTVYVTRLARRALSEQGELDSDSMDAAKEAQPATTEGGSSVRRFALPTVAVIMIVVTVLACSQRVALRGLFGPPSATLHEAYADHLTLMEIRIQDLLDGLASRFGTDAARKGLVYESLIREDVPEKIHTDPQVLQQALANVLNNSIKFTKESHIRLDVSLSHDPGSPCLEVAIEDTGIGVADEHRTLIFEPFCQADSKMNRQYGGAGRGLAVSKRFIELLGGTI